MDSDIFGRNHTDKVGNQKTLYYIPPQITCASALPGTCQNGETRKSHFHSIGWCYTHNAPVGCLPERKQEGQHPLTGQRAANFRLLAN